MVITTVTIDAPFLLANGFDKTWYDLEHPGVKAVYSDNGVSNEHHYINHGRHEGRYINAAMKSFFEEGTARSDFLAKRPYLITKTLPEDKIVVWLEYKSYAAAETAAAAARAAVAASAAAASLDYAATASAARGVLESANTDAIAARADLVLVDEAAAAARADLAIADSNATAARLVLTNAIAAEKTADAAARAADAATDATARAADAATDAAARAAAATFSADARAAAALVSSNARASLVLVDEAAATARTALEAADSTATAARAALAGDIALKQDIISASNKLAQANVEGLVAALAGKQATIDSSNKLAQSNIEGLVASLGGKQATISNGGLNIVQVSGLQTALDAKQATISASNKVAQANVEGLVSALASSGNTSLKLAEDASRGGETIVLDGVSAASRIDLTTAVFTTADLGAGSEFKFCNFKDSTTVKNLTSTGELIDFTGSSFENVDFSGVSFGAAAHVFKNCVFKGCDFRNTTLPANVVALTGCDFTNAIFGKVAATDTAFAAGDNAHDFSKSIFKNANLKGCEAFSQANLIMNYADWSEALFDAATDFTAVTNEKALGSKWHGLSVAPDSTKVVDAGVADEEMIFEKMADGKYYGIAPWADLRNLDFSNHVFTQNLEFGSTDISATANLLRAGTDIGDGIAVPDLKAGEYVAFGSARVDAIVDIDADTLAYALAFYGTSVSRADIPQVTKINTDKVAGITSTTGAVVHAQGSLAAYYFWMKNLSKTHFTGSGTRTADNVLASTDTTARINGATTNAQQVTIKPVNLTIPVGLVGTFGDAAGVFQLLGSSTDVGTDPNETFTSNTSDPVFEVNDALYAAVRVGDHIEMHCTDSAIETVVVSVKTDADVGTGFPNMLTVTARATGSGSGGTAQNLSTNYAKATDRVVIHRRFNVTAAAAGITALLNIKASGQEITADAAYSSGELATDLAGVTTALVAHHKSLNNGLKLDKYDLNSKTVALPEGTSAISIFKKLSKYELKQMIGPDQDLTHLKDYYAVNSAGETGLSAYDMGAAILNDTQLGNTHTGTDTLFRVDLDSVVMANNADFRHIRTGAGGGTGAGGAPAVLKEAAGADFDCAMITGTEQTNAVYGENFYAKGIKGRLNLSISGNRQVNSLYFTPGNAGQACDGAFVGPGVDLAGRALSGTSSSVLDITKSLEDADLSAITNKNLKYVNITVDAKNASFEGLTMLKVDINGSIEGANFKNISADGTSTTNKGLDLTGASALTATSVMPDFTGAQLAYATMPEVTGSATNKMKMIKGTSVVNLSNAVWASEHFEYVDMEGANLTGAHFQAATTDLTGSSFKNANLTNAKFKLANGTSALTQVILESVNMDGANITGMNDLLLAENVSDVKLARFINMIDNTAGADKASVQAKFAQGMVVIYKDGTGNFFGLPGDDAVELDLSNTTLGGTDAASLSINATQTMGIAKLTNTTMDYCTFNGTGNTDSTCAMIFKHDAANEKSYLGNFHIKNANLNSGTIRCVAITDDAGGSTIAQCWQAEAETVNYTHGNKATEPPSGAAAGVLELHGQGIYSNQGVILQNVGLSAARMVGGKTHEQTAINHSSGDLATYASSGIMGANLANNLFSGVKMVTDPGANLFASSTLPSAYKVVDNYLVGPNVTLGTASTAVEIANGSVLDGVDFTGSTLTIDAGSANGESISLKSANLSGVDFGISNLRASNFAGATVNATTDMSDLTITAHASDFLQAINLVGTFTNTNLPIDKATANQHNYAQDGDELVRTIVV